MDIVPTIIAIAVAIVAIIVLATSTAHLAVVITIIVIAVLHRCVNEISPQNHSLPKRRGLILVELDIIAGVKPAISFFGQIDLIIN